MADDGSFQERILKELDEIIFGEEELLSFSIVPAEDNSTNRTPVLRAERHLALESWCVRHVYAHARARLLEQRSAPAGGPRRPAGPRELARLLAGALLINPEVPTFWAMRRELVAAGGAGAGALHWRRELRFARLVLTHRSKCNEVFAYRRWLLRRVLARREQEAGRDGLTPVEWMRRLHADEAEAAREAAERAPTNYHAFGHRLWCAQHIADHLPGDQARVDLYLQELADSAKWIERHVSEHTGYHYRQQLIKRFRTLPSPGGFLFGDRLAEVAARLGGSAPTTALPPDASPVRLFLHLLGVSNGCSAGELRRDTGRLNYLTLLLWELLVHVEGLNSLFPEHESLWYHRRFVVYHLVQAFHEYHASGGAVGVATGPGSDIACMDVSNSDDIALARGDAMSQCGQKQPKMFKSQHQQIEASNLGQLLISTEQRFIAANSTGLQFQCNYAGRHAKWLKLVVGLHNMC